MHFVVILKLCTSRNNQFFDIKIRRQSIHDYVIQKKKRQSQYLSQIFQETKTNDIFQMIAACLLFILGILYGSSIAKHHDQSWN